MNMTLLLIRNTYNMYAVFPVTCLGYLTVY